MLDLTYSIFFALTLISSVLVVASRHAVYGALYLVVTMISIGGLFLMIGAELAAILQILVYAGAIMVLFLFVIMLLNLGRTGERPTTTRNVRRLGILFFIAFGVQAVALAVRLGGSIEFDPAVIGVVTRREVALALLTRYLYAFELTSVMLLIAVVGAVVLSRREGDPQPSATSEGG